MTSNAFISSEATPWQHAGDGVRRQILGHGPDLMLVVAEFKKGAIGPMHHHPHRQVSYVVSGAFEVTIDGATKVLRAGDSFFITADLVHGAVALEPGTLIDVFTPAREDFLR